MEDDLIIRIGSVEDMDEMMDLALMGCAENAFVNPDPGLLATDMWSLLSKDSGIVGIVCKADGPIEGAILLSTGKMWYSHDPVLEERAIFIHPDYRAAKVGRARKLCEFAKSVSDALGIPLIIGVLSNSRTEAKIRLYKRQFGEPAGAFFLYGAKTGEAGGNSPSED
jgi:hypothetical protein